MPRTRSVHVLGARNVKVSFLLCAYNEEQTIEETLRSILSQTVKPDEVIVVNDGSTDRTAEILRRFENECVVVHLQENTGNKARAQMIGLRYVTGDLVAFTDADTRLDPKFLENVLPYFLDPLVGGVSGQVLSEKKNWLTSVRQMQYMIGQSLYKRGMHELDCIMVIPGAAGIVRRELFSASFDTVTEDMDMTLRINELGHKIVYAPDAKAYTNDPSDLGSYVRQITRWYAGYFQNIKKHFGFAPLRIRAQMIIPFVEIFLTLSGWLMLLVTLLLSMNPIFLSVLIFDIVAIESFVIYGAIRLSRKDLLAQLPTYFFVRTIDTYVWLKCLIKELVFGKREFRWLRADRA